MEEHWRRFLEWSLDACRQLFFFFYPLLLRNFPPLCRNLLLFYHPVCHHTCFSIHFPQFARGMTATVASICVTDFRSRRRSSISRRREAVNWLTVVRCVSQFLRSGRLSSINHHQETVNWLVMVYLLSASRLKRL